LDALRKSHRPFKNRISWDVFQARLNSLGNRKKWSFVRASLLYQEALRCRKCNPSVSMLVLCSCAESMKVAGGKAGCRKNFKEFFLRYCPQGLRNPPIEYYPLASPPPVAAPFDKALDFIYKKFRCLYIHEGIGHLRPLPRGTTWIYAPLLDKYGKEIYVVDTLKILDWFLAVTFECLSTIL